MTQIITASKSLVYRRGIVRPSRVRRAAFRNLRKGLVLHLASPRRRGADEWFDSSGYNNHGTLTNMDPATAWVPSPYGWALDFDGSDDEIAIGNAGRNMTFPLTIMASVKLDSTALANNLCVVFASERDHGRYSGCNLYVRRDTGLIWSLFGNDTGGGSSGRNNKIGTTDLRDTQATITVVMRGQDDHSIYVDGVDDGGSYSGTASSMVFRSDTTSMIGYSFMGADDRRWKGLVDWVIIWDREISAQEVAFLYTTPNALLELLSRNLAVPPAPPAVVASPYYYESLLQGAG